jgi:dynein heavy chain
MKITNTQALKDAEQSILDILNNSEGKILENEDAVIALKESQELSEEIKFKQDEAKDTEERLEHARQAYTEIANLSALLFFIVQKLHLVDVMYQYSLSWYI